MAVQQFVDNAIKNNKVMVFSKSYCPYCTKAKRVLASLGLKPQEVKVIELDEEHTDEADAIQDYLAEVTGGRSVPRVFVKGKFVGGGDDTERKARSGELQQLLTAA